MKAKIEDLRKQKEIVKDDFSSYLNMVQQALCEKKFKITDKIRDKGRVYLYYNYDDFQFYYITYLDDYKYLFITEESRASKEKFILNNSLEGYLNHIITMTQPTLFPVSFNLMQLNYNKLKIEAIECRIKKK